jgi:hypothetical protein
MQLNLIVRAVVCVAMIVAASGSALADNAGALAPRDEFAVREAATDQLAHIGLPAFSALAGAAHHPDRDVRKRAEHVLGLIRQHDHERRLEAFLSGKDDGEEYPLPGWSRFRKSYGDEAAARALFVDMQRADPELLRALEENTRLAAETLGQRGASVQAMQSAQQRLSLGQVAAALFAASQDDVQLPTQTLAVIFNQCFQPQIRDALSTGSRRDIPRKMLAAIVSRSEGAAAYQSMHVAMEFKLPEGIVAAARILKNHETTPSAPMAHFALMTIAALGDASHLPLVEAPKLMQDTTQVGQFQESGTTYVIQLRDVALVAAIVLSKQNISDYFEVPRNQPLSNPQMIFLNPRLIGFPSDEQREAVFAKWKSNKASQAPSP